MLAGRDRPRPAGRDRLVVRYAHGLRVRRPALVSAESVPGGREIGMQAKQLCVSGRLGCGPHATGFQPVCRPSQAGRPLGAGCPGEAAREPGRKRGNVTFDDRIGLGARRRQDTAWP